MLSWSNFIIFFASAVAGLLTTTSATAQTVFPQGWWEQLSAQAVLEQAQAKTDLLPNFRGIKSHLLTVDSADRHYEYLQKRMLAGPVLKKISLIPLNRPVSTEYDLEDGRYYEYGTLLVKIEYDEWNDVERQIAQRIGGSAYNYQMLAASVVGTNECIVVARTMSEPMINGLSNFFRQQNARDLPRQYFPSVREFYIRKVDAVVLGFLDRNSTGELRGDQLCDSVCLDIEIPDSEIIPKQKSAAVVVKSETEYAKLVDKEIQKPDAYRYANESKDATSKKRIVLLGIMLVTTIGSITAMVAMISLNRKQTNNPNI